MLRRLKHFLLRPLADGGIEALYRTCVDQARQPVFYAELHVPDTQEGRFDLLILHVILVLQHVQGQGAQQLFNILFADMDRNLRESGVSDMRIAKKIKPLFEAFYGRAKVYAQALTETDAVLAEALRRNVFPAPASVSDVSRLTDYVRRTHTALAAEKLDAILAGRFKFPRVV